MGRYGLFEEWTLGKFRVVFFLRFGSVRVFGVDFFLGRFLGIERNFGAFVERGVDGVLVGALRIEEGSRGMFEIEIVGGKTLIFLLVVF